MPDALDDTWSLREKLTATRLFPAAPQPTAVPAATLKKTNKSVKTTGLSYASLEPSMFCQYQHFFPLPPAQNPLHTFRRYVELDATLLPPPVMWPLTSRWLPTLPSSAFPDRSNALQFHTSMHARALKQHAAADASSEQPRPQKREKASNKNAYV
jgi:hypothetical protein